MSESQTDLVRQAAQPLEVTRPQGAGLSIEQVFEAVMKQEISQEKVAVMKELLAMSAERQFAAAFVKLQAEIPKVKATKTVPNNDGTPRYTFAPFEEIDAQARPICARHGFSYSFDEGEDRPGKLTKVCVLAHDGGHTQRNSYSVRIGKGPPGCSDSQADGAAHSYAKRGALCDALNIIVKHQDNDARLEGGRITAEQARALRVRVLQTASDELAFLKYAQVPPLADNASVKEVEAAYLQIPANMLATLDRNLKKKENTR